MQRASLTAGAVILLVAMGALALVRAWGLRLPRPLVILPALAGSTLAIAHALSERRAYCVYGHDEERQDPSTPRPAALVEQRF